MRREKNLEAAYNKHADMVMRICYLHLKNTEDAKDVLQEVFIKFIAEEKAFESEEHEKAWLLRVAINKCKNIQNSFWRKNTHSIGEVEIAFNQNIESEVIEAVFNLRPKYKVPIHLHYYEGYSVPEIASILNQKENTIYSNLHRARKELKEKLGGDFCEGTL